MIAVGMLPYTRWIPPPLCFNGLREFSLFSVKLINELAFILFQFVCWRCAYVHTHMHMWNPVYRVSNKSIILVKIKVYLVFANIGAYLQYFVSVCPSKWFYFIVKVLLNLFTSFCTYQSFPPLYNYIYLSACILSCASCTYQHNLIHDANFLIHFLIPLISLLVTNPWIHSTLVLRHQLSQPQRISYL